MRLLNNTTDRNLMTLVIMLFVILCCIEAGFKLPSIFEGNLIGRLLVNPSAKNISSSAITSVLAAYIFYLFVEVIPRSRKKADTKAVLDSLLAAILDAFNRCRIFGHETAISHVDKSVLAESWLRSTKEKLKEESANFLPLKFAMQTAHTRLEDFRNTLPLAVNLSLEDATRWLVIIDKVRLLAENYGSQPEVAQSELHLIDSSLDENPLKAHKSTLNLRLLEIVEQTIEWQGFNIE